MNKNIILISTIFLVIVTSFPLLLAGGSGPKGTASSINCGGLSGDSDICRRIDRWESGLYHPQLDCDLTVKEIVLKVNCHDNPEQICEDDEIQVKALLDLEYQCDPAVFVKLYLDGTFYDDETVMMNPGEAWVIFDRLIDTSDLDLGEHTIKVFAYTGCDEEGDFKTKDFEVEDCTPDECILDIYTYGKCCQNPLITNIYVDGIFKGENDHLAIIVEPGEYFVETMQDCYYSESKTVTCDPGETEIVELCLDPCECEEECEIEIEDIVLKVDCHDNPDQICEDDEIQVKAQISLDYVPDDPEVTVKLYLDGGLYDTEIVDMGSETIWVIFDEEIDASELDIGEHEIEVVAEVECDEDGDSKTITFEIEDCDGCDCPDCPSCEPCDCCCCCECNCEVNINVDCCDCDDCDENDCESECDCDDYCDCDDEDDFSINVYDLEIDPDEVDQGEEIEIEAKVKLTEAPSGEHEVTVRWYVDGDLVKTRTYEMEEDDVETVSYDYDTEDLDEGKYDVKVKASVEGESDYEEDNFRVGEDYEDYGIEVRYINLDDSTIDLGDTLSGSVKIELEEADDLPSYVDIRLYINDHLELSDDMKFNYLGTKTFYFSLDTDDFDEGENTIEIRAYADGASDSSERNFEIEDYDRTYNLDGTGDCLTFYKFYIKENLVAGESAKVYAKVLNCGGETQSSVKVRLSAFGKFYDRNIGTLKAHESEEFVYDIYIPDDESGQITFYGKVWSADAEDIVEKDFVVYTGIPYVDLEDDYKVRICDSKEIEFEIRNHGQAGDVFDIAVLGEASGWISGIPSSIELGPHQTKKVTAVVDVPCDTESGYYGFEIILENTEEYVGSSQIRATAGWKWPTGWTWKVGDRELPSWVVVFVIIVFLILVALYWKAYKIRKTPM